MWEQAMEDAWKKTLGNLRRAPGLFPHITSDKRYEWGENRDWIEGFYTGMTWLCYEYTGKEEFRESALMQVESFRERLHVTRRNLDHHDIGFLYQPSAVAAWIIDRDEAARTLALEAAEHLMLRWRPEGRYLQAWGPKGDPQNGGRIIIDCMMNLPLLYWAFEQTGDMRYREAAEHQADKSRRYLMRGDDSSYHTFYFREESGIPIGGGTHQGYHDGSTWSRGQAWAVYGFALSYRYTQNREYLETAIRAARYFIGRLLLDGIPYWDFDAEIADDTPRDSSALAIAVCGMLEICLLLEEDDPIRAELDSAADRLLKALVERCATLDDDGAEGLLKHGSYHVRGGRGPDDYMIWGDYFYVEALMRSINGRAGYWYERQRA